MPLLTVAALNAYCSGVEHGNGRRGTESRQVPVLVVPRVAPEFLCCWEGTWKEARNQSTCQVHADIIVYRDVDALADANPQQAPALGQL